MKTRIKLLNGPVLGMFEDWPYRPKDVIIIDPSGDKYTQYTEYDVRELYQIRRVVVLAPV